MPGGDGPSAGLVGSYLEWMKARFEGGQYVRPEMEAALVAAWVEEKGLVAPPAARHCGVYRPRVALPSVGMGQCQRLMLWQRSYRC